MTSAGKGDTPRPLSVDQTTFENNWERTFRKQTDQVPTLSEKFTLYNEYKEQLDSGKFWELHPELTGNWEIDKETWYKNMGT